MSDNRTSNGHERGKQHTPHLANQPRDFSGLRYGKITPTDNDAFMDFGNHLFVYVDAKLPGVEMDRGQELALERQVDECKHDAVLIIGEHKNREGAIDFANCIVTKYYWKKQWRFLKSPLTVRAVIDAMLRHCNLDHYLA